MSEDTSLLKNEIDKGQKYLMQLAALRDECAKLGVSKSSRLFTRVFCLVVIKARIIRKIKKKKRDYFSLGRST